MTTAEKLDYVETAMTFYIYAEDGAWRWVLSDRTGRVFAVSGETYIHEEECRRAIAAVMRSGGALVLRA